MVLNKKTIIWKIMLVFYKHKNVILVIIKVENFLNLINTKQGVTNEVAK